MFFELKNHIDNIFLKQNVKHTYYKQSFVIFKNNYQLIIRSIIKLIKNSIQNESVKKKYFSSVSPISSPVGKEKRMK